MPRRKLIAKRDLPPDPRYNSVLVQQFVNYLMDRGKKSTAESIFYGAMDVIQEKTGQDPMAVFKQALNNVKPTIEVTSRRVGGATYQVPVEVRPVRRTGRGAAPGAEERGTFRQEAGGHAQDGRSQQGVRALPLVERAGDWNHRSRRDAGARTGPQRQSQELL